MKLLRIHIIFLFFCIPVSVSGQFLNVQIDVIPEIETLVEQPLDFGQIVTNSGLQQIELGDPNMGIFRIRALRAQRLFISLDSDEELRSQNPGNSQTIPIELQASYTQNGIDNYQSSTPLSSLFEDIVIESPPEEPLSAWSSAYIYIYGNIDVGNVPAGTYRGEIVLTVIYE